MWTSEPWRSPWATRPETMKVTVVARRDGDTGDTIDDFKMIYYDHDDDDYDDDDDLHFFLRQKKNI